MKVRIVATPLTYVRRRDIARGCEPLSHQSLLVRRQTARREFASYSAHRFNMSLLLCRDGLKRPRVASDTESQISVRCRRRYFGQSGAWHPSLARQGLGDRAVPARAPDTRLDKDNPCSAPHHRWTGGTRLWRECDHVLVFLTNSAMIEAYDHSDIAEVSPSFDAREGQQFQMRRPSDRCCVSWRIAHPKIRQFLVHTPHTGEQNLLGHQKSRERLDAAADPDFGSLVGIFGLMIVVNELDIDHAPLLAVCLTGEAGVNDGEANNPAATISAGPHTILADGTAG